MICVNATRSVRCITHRQYTSSDLIYITVLSALTSCINMQALSSENGGVFSQTTLTFYLLNRNSHLFWHPLHQYLTRVVVSLYCPLHRLYVTHLLLTANNTCSYESIHSCLLHYRLTGPKRHSPPVKMSSSTSQQMFPEWCKMYSNLA